MTTVRLRCYYGTRESTHSLGRDVFKWKYRHNSLRAATMTFEKMFYYYFYLVCVPETRRTRSRGDVRIVAYIFCGTGFRRRRSQHTQQRSVYIGVYTISKNIMRPIGNPLWYTLLLLRCTSKQFLYELYPYTLLPAAMPATPRFTIRL